MNEFLMGFLVGAFSLLIFHFYVMKKMDKHYVSKLESFSDIIAQATSIIEKNKK
jgi:hypothetical protein